MHLAANASDQAADDGDGEEEESNEDADADRALEEHNERAFQVGFVRIWLNFSLQFVVVEQQVGSVEFIGDFVTTEVIDHALGLLWFVRVLIFQQSVNSTIDAIVNC